MLTMTAGVNADVSKNAEFAKFVLKALARFNAGDWGDTDPMDAKMNDAVVRDGSTDRIMAAYGVPADIKVQEGKIWVCRECADVSDDGTPTMVTTVLFPSEY